MFYFTKCKFKYNVLFQIIRILDHVKESMKKMISFDPGDVIFLLNRWDNISKDEDEDAFFYSTKMYIGSIWKEVKSERIMKLCMEKVCTCYESPLGTVMIRDSTYRINVIRDSVSK